MLVLDTDIPEVKLIKPLSHGDSRGFFLETFQQERYKEMGINYNFIQDNHSRSKKNTLRGLHYQSKNMQGKLVRVSQGSVYDVAVDIRKGSPTYGLHVAVELSGENKRQLFVPRGFAHGFSVLSESAVFAYKVDNTYAPAFDAGIRYDDKELNIDWGLLEKDVQLSVKDKNLSFFTDFDSPFQF